MGLASLLFVLGSVVMGIAPEVIVLIVGRFIVGLAIGIAAIVSPVYIAGTPFAFYMNTRYLHTICQHSTRASLSCYNNSS